MFSFLGQLTLKNVELHTTKPRPVPVTKGMSVYEETLYVSITD